MAEKKNEVAEKKTAEVIQFDPSMFEADAGTGLENMGQDDLALPFLKILGGMSRELDDLEDAKKGDIYNTVSGGVYRGKDGIRVIPVAYQRGSSNGPPEAKERAHRWQSMLRVRLGQKPSVQPKITKNMLPTVPVSISKRPTSIL